MVFINYAQIMSLIKKNKEEPKTEQVEKIITQQNIVKNNNIKTL